MHTFVTPVPPSAVLDIPAGRVRIIAADRADTTVEVLPADASHGRDVKAAEQTEVRYEDGTLRVESSARSRILGSSGSVEVTIHLPTGSRVDAKAASAGFRCTGRLGDVVYEGAHGPVEIAEAASARLTVLAGDISVGRLGGPAEISAGKGDIRIAEARSGKVDLRTEAGEISVGAARGVSASLDAGTGFGRIHNSLRNTEGSAGLSIHAITAYGDITARSL